MLLFSFYKTLWVYISSVFIFLNDYSGAFTSLAAIVAVITGLKGYPEWKNRLKGKTNYEVARRYLTDLYRLREAIKIVRNPGISIGEMKIAREKVGLPPIALSGSDKDTNAAVYFIRWEKIQEAWAALETNIKEAEVSWGEKIVAMQEELRKKILFLSIEIEKMLSGEPEIRPQRDIIYAGGTDNFQKEVNNQIKIIEDFLRPYLE